MVKLYREAFAQLMSQTRSDGGIGPVCGDETVASELAAQSGKQVVRYGLGETNTWRALDRAVNGLGGTDFGVYHANQGVGRVSLQVPGKHNVLDALAAIAAGGTGGSFVRRHAHSVTKFSRRRTALSSARHV